MELATKKTLPDTLEWVKVSGVAWHGDGFYYSRYPAPGQGQVEMASINEDHRVYFHKVGTPQSQDRLVYEDEANAQRFHIVETTEDERFALLTISDRGKGKNGNALFVRDLSRGQREFKPVIREIGNDALRRHRQRRRQAAGRDQQERAERARRARRSAKAGRGELEDRPAREAGTAAGRRAPPAASSSRPI